MLPVFTSDEYTLEMDKQKEKKLLDTLLQTKDSMLHTNDLKEKSNFNTFEILSRRDSILPTFTKSRICFEEASPSTIGTSLDVRLIEKISQADWWGCLINWSLYHGIDTSVYKFYNNLKRHADRRQLNNPKFLLAFDDGFSFVLSASRWNSPL